LLSGILLKVRPKHQLSSSLGKAAAVYGLLLSGYQVYASLLLVTGILAVIEVVSIVIFVVLAFFNAVLIYGSFPKGSDERA
jgi:hypothetical protein